MRGVSTFLNDERGAESIAFLLWVPVNATLLVLVTDACFIYQAHAASWDVARDTARRMVVGQLSSADEAEGYALGELVRYHYPFTATAEYDPSTQMSIIVSVPIAEVAIFGTLLEPVFNNSMDARVVMRAEPA